MDQVLSDAGVSAREAEVLDALAEHLTNAEIAARLYISIRTVESHVSSLLRKLRLGDRRELARFAADLASATSPADSDDDQSAVDDVKLARPTLPAPLTSFVGRVEERSALADALRDGRLVTALGPGGVGKTRLALAVAADAVTDFDDGVWFVDLVPVTDPAMIAAAVAAALDLGGDGKGSAEETVARSLADRHALLVLDNCEHLVDGVGAFVEGLLARCPRLVVLATSRTRLLLPFETVFPVPGLSLPPDLRRDDLAHDAASESDAVALFLERAGAVGWRVTSDDDRRRVARICRALDGSALAIELAAARLPGLGIDGLEAGLEDRVRLLTGGSRLNERHSSLRATLDWSYELARPDDQALLRRVAVFAAPFDTSAAAAVAGFDPLPTSAPQPVADALARLVDESLVTVSTDADGTRYRVLETIRQYGMSRLDDGDETTEVRERHLQWCQAVASELVSRIPPTLTGDEEPGWGTAFDAVAPDLRAALGWVANRPGCRGPAHAFALSLARLAEERGRADEAQRCYEQAAELAGDQVAAAAALRSAGDVATAHHSGDEALRLFIKAANLAEAAGEKAIAAIHLAQAATLANRGPGTFQELPPPLDIPATIERARSLSGGDLRAEAAIAVAEAFDAYRGGFVEEADAARRAAELAHRASDAVLESAALDDLTISNTGMGDLADAAVITRRRIELLAEVPRSVGARTELIDAYHMAVEMHLGVGDLHASRRYAKRLLAIPSYREGHLSSIRAVLSDALAGELDRVERSAVRFRRNWERLGRPYMAYLALGTGAVAMAYGLRGDQDARDEWLAITSRLRSAIERFHEETFQEGLNSWAPTFDAIVLLHEGRPDDAVARMVHDPEPFRQWYNGAWRQWYAAVWAEAAALADHREADERLGRARKIAAGNPVATAILDRTVAWLQSDRDGMAAAATALDKAGCRYQAARTRVLAGGAARSRGEDAMLELGAAPMAVP